MDQIVCLPDNQEPPKDSRVLYSENKQSVYLVRKPLNTQGSKYLDIKCAIAGSVDAGKSSLIGTLIAGSLDDGRGLSRSFVFKHPHEQKSGRTSDVVQHIVGINLDSNFVNKPRMKWEQIVESSCKVITFFDLAGHEKYLKTTIRGLSFAHPDYVLIIVGGNMGVTNMTEEHMKLCVSLNIPYAVIITKIDICKDRKEILKGTYNDVCRLIRKTDPMGKLKPFVIKSVKDVVMTSKELYNFRLVPVFMISNVTGENTHLMKEFINLCQPAPVELVKMMNHESKEGEERKDETKVMLMIESLFAVKGTGQVIGGQLETGVITTGDKLVVGPDSLGNYHNVVVRSIHRKRVPMDTVYAGSYVCLGIGKFQDPKFRVSKGMVAVSEGCEKSVSDFTARITVLHHATSIKVGYEPVIHVSGIRQACKIMDIKNKQGSQDPNDDRCLRSGDTADVVFRTKNKPEYIYPGMRVVICEGRSRGVGVITSVQ